MTPTDAEMIAWLRDCAMRAEARGLLGNDAARAEGMMLRAIAARLRTSAGIAHEPPTFEAAPGNVTSGNFPRSKD